MTPSYPHTNPIQVTAQALRNLPARSLSSVDRDFPAGLGSLVSNLQKLYTCSTLCCNQMVYRQISTSVQISDVINIMKLTLCSDCLAT